MDIFLYVIISGLFICLIIAAVRFLKVNRIVWPRKIEPIEPHFRVLIGLRRRSAGVGQIVSMSEDEHASVRIRVSEQWQDLCKKWSQLGAIQGGFRKSEQGLPAGGDEDWFLIAFLDIPDYKTFRECISTLDNRNYRDLRNFCDVRIILGDRINGEDADIREFF